MDDQTQNTAPSSRRAVAGLSERGRTTAESPAATTAPPLQFTRLSPLRPILESARRERKGIQTWGWRSARARPRLQRGIDTDDERIPQVDPPGAETNPSSRLDSIASASSSPTSGFSLTDQLTSCPRPKDAMGVGIRRLESPPPSPRSARTCRPGRRSFRLWRRFGPHRATVGRGGRLRIPGASADFRSDAPCGANDRGLSSGFGVVEAGAPSAAARSRRNLLARI